MVCVGGGPSLTPDDVDRCRGYPVVAINDAYRLAPWAAVLYAADAKWWRWHGGAPDFEGLRYSLQDGASKWGVEILENTGPRGLEPHPTGLRTGRNGGYQAINLAVHLGAARIVLLGYDMRYSRGKTGRTHWFGDHPDRVPPNVSSYAPEFMHLINPLAELGIPCLNASRDTALEAFPRVTLEQALAAG